MTRVAIIATIAFGAGLLFGRLSLRSRYELHVTNGSGLAYRLNRATGEVTMVGYEGTGFLRVVPPGDSPDPYAGIARLAK